MMESGLHAMQAHPRLAPRRPIRRLCNPLPGSRCFGQNPFPVFEATCSNPSAFASPDRFDRRGETPPYSARHDGDEG